jgi:hypothetical protein
MAGWFERLFRAFVEFRPARNWKCRYPPHRGEHYQDEIVVQDGASEWYLHGKLIARLVRVEHPIYELYLTNAGYSTVTTMSRLNGIIWLFRDILNIDLKIQFRLKYESAPPSYPVYTYVEHDGLDYMVNHVKILLDMAERRVLRVDLPPEKAIYHFMKHGGLSYARKLFYKLREIKSQLDDALDRLTDLVHDLDVKPTQEMISLAQRIYEFRDAYKAIYELGLPYGIYATHVEDAKDTLKSLIREGNELLTRARVILAELTLLNA